MGMIDNTDKLALKKAVNQSSLALLMGREGLYKGCKVEYGYNQRQRIYSIKVMLDNRPRIITVRVGENFTEMSLADQKGNVLEVLRQDDAKGITFSKTD
ncbi:hypothetical protein L0Y65_04150 [Candidatus Micrarchaeota archaeon]|nr:hypothetical protein [Candidatus Micrarchaeota archaeon]